MKRCVCCVCVEVADGTIVLGVVVAAMVSGAVGVDATTIVTLVLVALPARSCAVTVITCVPSSLVRGVHENAPVAGLIALLFIELPKRASLTLNTGVDILAALAEKVTAVPGTVVVLVNAGESVMLGPGVAVMVCAVVAERPSGSVAVIVMVCVPASAAVGVQLKPPAEFTAFDIIEEPVNESVA